MLKHDTHLDDVFKALADGGRRHMIARLCQSPASVSELAKPLNMTLSAVMQHLHILENAGLVITKKQGRRRTCSIDKQQLSQAEDWLEAQRTLWEQRFDQLDVFLQQTDKKND